MKKIALFAAAILTGASVSASVPAFAAGPSVAYKQLDWPFEGPFGTVDDAAAQRGYQVYREVCAACHSMDLVYFRNLEQIGFSEGEVKTIAAEYTVEDGPDDNGDMFDRPGRPSDSLPAPYANKKAAAASNGGAYPPDLSLMVKARPDGANYMYSLLTGYQEPPADAEENPGKYWNTYFPGHWISMPPPLNEGQVTYGDGTEASVEQMAKDVTVFLQWAAEPEMEARKQTGVKVLLFLLIFTVLFYLSKRRIWSDVK